MHITGWVATAFAAAFLKNDLKLATLIFVFAVGAVVLLLVFAVRRLDKVTETIGGVLLRIEYMHVGVTHHGLKTTEGLVHRRAAEEVRKARHSVDVFTSYLLEEDCPDEDDRAARGEYFKALIAAATREGTGIKYRRLVQASSDRELAEELGEHAQLYLKHLIEMRRLDGATGSDVHVRYIDRRRPTTFVIIDNELLLWQVNEIRSDHRMEMHGVFVVEDPHGELIQHFRAEFDRYWDGPDARPLKLSSGLRT